MVAELQVIKSLEQSNTHDDEKYPRITAKLLKLLCKQQKLYQTPYLNDVLYLHFKGFAKIENLDEYTGLKCLWLECNGITQIENISHLKQLKCLYLQQNLISKIENIEQLSLLDTLNVSNNTISKIENISCLKHLNTLQISHNRLTCKEDIEHLIGCESLSVVDLSHNRINDADIVGVFRKMNNLRVVNLMGNNVIREIKNYRKTMILNCVHLKYLDDRPVFPKERACAQAWQTGGREAEMAESERWVNKERRRIQDSVDFVSKLRENALKKKDGCSEQIMPSDNGEKITEISSDKEEKITEISSDKEEKITEIFSDEDFIKVGVSTDEIPCLETIDNQHVTTSRETPALNMNPLTDVNPILQAYPHHFKAEANNSIEANNSDIGSKDETTEFFDNLSKLANLSPFATTMPPPKNEAGCVAPLITTNESITKSDDSLMSITSATNSSSGFFSSNNSTTLESKSSPSFLLVDDVTEDDDLETIHLDFNQSPNTKPLIQEIETTIFNKSSSRDHQLTKARDHHLTKSPGDNKGLYEGAPGRRKVLIEEIHTNNFMSYDEEDID